MHHDSSNGHDPSILKQLFTQQIPEPFKSAAEANETARALASAATEQGLGATGKFPEGKATPTDEGEIKFLIGHKGGVVVLEFGKSVRWVGMNPDQALELASSLRAHALKARRNEG